MILFLLKKYGLTNDMWRAEMLPVYMGNDPDNKVHGANMGPTWVLSVPDGPHVDPMNLAI